MLTIVIFVMVSETQLLFAHVLIIISKMLITIVNNVLTNVNLVLEVLSTV